jgi:hypothetical protein
LIFLKNNVKITSLEILSGIKQVVKKPLFFSMTLIHRRLLYGFFFLLFFLLAPFIILISEGYQIDWQHFRFQKTGVLFLESKPNNADIYLNDQKVKNQTTARLKNLAPAEYLVTLKKEGYFAWTKKLRVYPGNTTFAQYIRLFKENIFSEKIITEKIKVFSPEINRQMAFIAADASVIKLFLFDFDKGQTKEITTLNFLPQEIIMAENGNHFLLNDSAAWWLLTREFLGGNQLKKISTASATQIKKIAFHPRNPTEIFELSNLGFRHLDTTTEKITILIPANVADFYLSSDKIYYLKNNSTQTELLSFVYDQPDTAQLETTLLAGTYAFAPGHDPFLCLLEKTKNNFYLFQQANQKLNLKENTFADVTKIIWHPNGQAFLFGNDFELWVYDNSRPENKKQLIIRLGSPIQGFWWYPIQTHVLFSTPEGLFVTEVIGNNVVRDTVNFSALKNTSSLWLNDKGDKIYWLDKENNFFVSQIQ